MTTGLLTHPGMHEHYFGNLAFRRVRWVQETFACTAFPAEIADAPLDVQGATPYTGKFPFASIARLMSSSDTGVKTIASPPPDVFTMPAMGV